MYESLDYMSCHGNTNGRFFAKKTLMLVINVKLLNFLNRFIGIISLERLFPSSIADTMNRFKNSMSD